MNYIFKEIEEKIKPAKRILLASHHNPDEDACGSTLALATYIKSLGKEPVIYMSGKMPAYLSFLPFFDDIIYNATQLSNHWDLIIVLDCGDLDRACLPINFPEAEIINIDHHISNSNFGKINLVRQASSTSEIIYDYLIFVDFKFDKKTATSLLTGIIGDTGGFAHSCTEISTIKATSDLIRQGANMNYIFTSMLQNKSIRGLRLWGEALSRLEVNEEYEIAFTYLKKDDFIKFDISEDELGGLANFLNIISDAKIKMLLKYADGIIKVSMRTSENDIDLSRIAEAFHGGGHKKAAGFEIEGELKEDNGKLIII